MNKVHNNLTIDNLVKTEWINQFDEEQKSEILDGLKKGLDVSIYAKSEFDVLQMIIIREGLENNVDVSIYVKPEISWQEMEIARLELLKKIKRIK